MKKKAKKKAGKTEAPEIDPRFAPVVRAFSRVLGVKTRKLFSSYGLKAKGKIFAMYGKGKIMVKLPRERVNELVEAKRGERFDPGQGRLMKEWVALKDGESGWVELAWEAYEFVRKRQS